MFNHKHELQTELEDMKFCYQLIITLTKFVIYKAFKKFKTEEIPSLVLASSEKSHLSACIIAHTVQLLRHGAYCPNKLSYKG